MGALALIGRKPVSSLAGAVLFGVYGWRAATGLPAAWAYRAGEDAAAQARHAESAAAFDRAEVGSLRVEALWQAGRARLDSWNAMSPETRLRPPADRLPDEALRCFLEERIAAPASAWPLAEIGNVYAERERLARASRVADLSTLDRGPASLVGDEGRIAIGLTRAAIEREPNAFAVRDQLVLLLEDNGLREEAIAAIEDSARTLPDFGLHPDFSVETLPRELTEAFWRASRAIDISQAPLQSRERHLLSLGQLARRLGHLDDAEQDLRAALETPGTRLAHAEDAFHLAQVLVDRSRFDEAEVYLAHAMTEPVFIPGVAETRVRIAVTRERWPEALDQLRILRRARPRDPNVLLQLAWVAGKQDAWDEAEEALQWAIVVSPGRAEPRRALVELAIARKDPQRARRALDAYIAASGNSDDTARLEGLLAGALDRVPR